MDKIRPVPEKPPPKLDQVVRFVWDETDPEGYGTRCAIANMREFLLYNRKEILEILEEK